MAGKFVVNTGKDGKHYFRLKAGNGEIIFSSQGYAARKSCLNGIESVRKNSQDQDRFEVRTAKVPSERARPAQALAAGCPTLIVAPGAAAATAAPARCRWWTRTSAGWS